MNFLKIMKKLVNSLLHLELIVHTQGLPSKRRESLDLLIFIMFGITILPFGFYILTTIQNLLPLFQTPDQSCRM